ncbi:SDR family NAD(P)-dependent oxidoreductase [Spelaeicoccus albus]|uniref:NAD(P)-dependent dehydrogenase (Short-subunit alcohol dehydrogenase family) n=1 Tax=Spelaeicoccus albus TaxID=1280376 RepID=A0A7Z0D529_9MICO|nr:SDR family oxidoreductase [Spelaeicoccus albus]NYI69042.1 NAD(P)-dependent dehydrogenase (short-subunit alcohol dehydrogenase family) [Spelaeicoccus albus]
MQRFTGRTAFVTGAADGIGKAIARRLIDEGGSVAVTDIDAQAAEATARELAADADAAAASVIGVEADVCDRASVDRAVATAVTRFGGIDILVNNVGIDYGGPFEDITDDTWAAQTDPTLYGAVRCVQATLPHLLRSDHAAVVAIASVNGMSAISGEAYSTAKAGIINLMANLAVRYSPVRLAARAEPATEDPSRDGPAELPRGIRFNAVSPGTIHTGVWDRRGADGAADLERMRRLYPMGRVGRPDDIAAAVAFLASDDASWITGINLPVEGGLLAGPQFLR